MTQDIVVWVSEFRQSADKPAANLDIRTKSEHNIIPSLFSSSDLIYLRSNHCIKCLIISEISGFRVCSVYVPCMFCEVSVFNFHTICDFWMNAFRANLLILLDLSHSPRQTDSPLILWHFSHTLTVH
jgi:hypothetical protein